MRESKVDILNERMTGALLKLAWPSVTSFLLQSLYNIIDTFWLGKLGKLEVSAPTIAWPIIFLVLSVGIGLSVAGIALVSQYTGKGEHRTASQAAGQTLIVGFSVATVLGVLGGIGSEWILSILKIPEELFPLTNIYLKTILYGAPLAFGTILINSIFSGRGDTITPMKIMIASVTLNAVVDPILIFGVGFPGLGVQGAALATVFSRGAVLFYALHLLFSGKKGFRIHFSDLIPVPKMMLRVMRIGFPSSIGGSVTSVAFIIITAMIAQFGPVVTSAVGVGNRVISLATMFSMGLAQATSAMVGQYLGAERRNDAYRVVWKSSAINMAVVGAICLFTFLLGRQVTALFINEPDVLVEGAKFFRIVSLSVPFFATFNIFDGGLRGSGHTVKSMILNITRLWVIRLPAIYFFGQFMGVIGIYYAMLLSNMAIAVAAGLVIISKRWLRPVV